MKWQVDVEDTRLLALVNTWNGTMSLIGSCGQSRLHLTKFRCLPEYLSGMGFDTDGWTLGH